MRTERRVKCDFCEADIGMEEIQLNKNGSWSWGEQGRIFYWGMSGTFSAPIKDSCPKELCKARLLVWTRS